MVSLAVRVVVSSAGRLEAEIREGLLTKQVPSPGRDNVSSDVWTEVLPLLGRGNVSSESWIEAAIGGVSIVVGGCS